MREISIMLTDSSQKIPVLFECKKCDYTTSSKKDFNKHNMTIKHNLVKNAINANSLNIPPPTKLKAPLSSNNHFNCLCGKVYTHRSTLSRHSKTCEKKNNTHHKTCINEEKDLFTTTLNDHNKLIQMFMEVIKQNNEFKVEIKSLHDTIQEIIPKIGINSTINHHNHNENKLNINIFLNEKCKDATNISDFVKSIQLHMCDVQHIGELGYVKGISNIIIKHLNTLDIYKRPIHCTDAKRDTLYIKDNDAWEKQDKEQSKIKEAIQNVSNAGYKLLSNLDMDDEDTLQIVLEVTGGDGVDHEKQDDKIINLISKATTIEKV